MPEYNIYPAVDANYNFPPQIKQTIVSYPEILDTQGRVDEAERKLVENEKQLAAAKAQLLASTEDLRILEEVELPAAVEKLEQADAAASVELGQLDTNLTTAKQEIAATEESINTLKTVTLPTMRQELEAAQAQAQTTLDELNDRLTGIDAVGTGELATIRDALSSAQQVANNANTAAIAADQAASAASQAALEAAGIAASKGRVIIQDTEPMGDDRHAANIWIKPAVDDPDTDITETATTYVYIADTDTWMPTTSDELAQAAQNALDAREAADQAKQRAETAISNAATAQSAAEAAQRTADTATTDAREAHNNAVDAQKAADSAMRSATSSNLLVNGGFDDQIEGLPDGWVLDPLHVYQEVPSPRSGWGIRMDPGRGVGTEVTHPVSVSPGRTYRIGGWVYVPAGTVVGGASYNKIRISSGGVFLEAIDFPSGPTESWVKIEGDRTFDVGNIDLQIFSDLSDGPAWIDDVFIYDVTEAVAAQARADEAMTEASEAKGLAEEAVREVGDTVRNTVIEYAVNTSETVAPTSGWSTSTPTRTPGSFVWMRTIVTYADGDTSTTSPALLTGNDGAKGDKGATGAKGDKGDRGTDGVPGKNGVGLSSTTLAYALSTSGTTAPSSGWTSSVPTPVKGRYLWTRTTWTYTDSSTETGYSVAYLATDGAKGNDGVAGKDGVGIRSTAITYASSSSGTTAPSSGWSSQPPAASAGQYVWTKTVWTYTDNSTETGYSVGKIGNTGAKGATGSTGAKGDKGDTGSTGAQGVSVSSVDPFFRTVSRSSGAPARPSGMTPSGWVTTEPAWSSNTKLYRAERIVYSNGVVSWTVPTLVAAYEGIVQVQTSVNGKNSITRSTSNPSGSGVVAGDAWYKVDSNGDAMGMWIWSGSKWVASKVRNEMIDTVDVNKLKVHNSLEVVGDAVIEKLWADGIAARAATFGSVTVASGNLLSWFSRRTTNPTNISPHRKYGSGAEDIRWAFDSDFGECMDIKLTDTETSSRFIMQFYASQPTSVVTDFGTGAFPIKGGQDYRLEMALGAGGSYPNGHPALKASFYWYGHNGSRVSISGGDIVNSEGGQRLLYTNPERSGVTTKAPDNAAYVHIFLSASNTGHIYMIDPEFRPLVGAVQISDGAVNADKVNAESVAGAVGKFVEAEVGKLKANVGTIGEAVINKVWADGIAAKSATFNRVTVASGDLLPDFNAAVKLQNFTELGYWQSFGINQVDPSFWVAGNDRSARYIEYEFPMTKGVRYAFEMQVRASKVGAAFYVQLYNAESNSYIKLIDPDGLASTTYPFSSVKTTNVSSFVATYRSSGVSDTTSSRIKFRIFPNHTSGVDNTGGYMWFTNVSVRPMTGSVLIEPGAITTPKLTVTQDMAAKIAQFMSVSTKELIVTGGATINNAKLIGDTWAENLTASKIIGTNGVFNGTVDANKINAGSFSGKTFTGGTFTGARLNAVDSAGYGLAIIPKTSADNAAIFFTDDGGLDTGQAAIWRNGYTKDAPAELWLRGAHGADVRVEDNLYVNLQCKARGLESRTSLQVDANGYVDRNLYVGGGKGGSGGSLFAPNVDVDTYHVRDRITLYGAASFVNYGDMQQHGSSVYFHNLPSSSSSGNMVISNTTRRAHQNFSTRRVKSNIEDWSPLAEQVLALQPRQWIHDDPNNEPEDNGDHAVGFIAEEVEEAGLTDLVIYGTDGLPQSLSYDRFPAAQQVVLQKHEAEIQELRAENDELKNRLSALEATVEQLVALSNQNGSN